MLVPSTVLLGAGLVPKPYVVQGLPIVCGLDPLTEKNALPQTIFANS